MIRAIAIAALALTLTACGTTKTDLPVITKNHYIPVAIDPVLLNPNSCPWPNAPEGTNESEYSDYMIDGFLAWACENDTRKTIKNQNDRQITDIEARNKEADAVLSGKTKEGEKKKKSGLVTFN